MPKVYYCKICNGRPRVINDLCRSCDKTQTNNLDIKTYINERFPLNDVIKQDMDKFVEKTAIQVKEQTDILKNCIERSKYTLTKLDAEILEKQNELNLLKDKMNDLIKLENTEEDQKTTIQDCELCDFEHKTPCKKHIDEVITPGAGGADEDCVFSRSDHAYSENSKKKKGHRKHTGNLPTEVSGQNEHLKSKKRSKPPLKRK